MYSALLQVSHGPYIQLSLDEASFTMILMQWFKFILFFRNLLYFFLLTAILNWYTHFHFYNNELKNEIKETN